MLKRKRAKEKGIVGLSKKFKEFKKGSKAILVRKLGGKESFPRQFNGLTVEIQGKLFIDSELSEKEDIKIARLGSKATNDFIMDFDGFCNRNVPDSAVVKFEIEATKSIDR